MFFKITKLIKVQKTIKHTKTQGIAQKLQLIVKKRYILNGYCNFWEIPVKSQTLQKTQTLISHTKLTKKNSQLTKNSNSQKYVILQKRSFLSTPLGGRVFL